MNIVKSGRYTYDINSATGTIQIFTMKPHSPRSHFLDAQEALDLLHYLQAHENELVAQVEKREASA